MYSNDLKYKSQKYLRAIEQNVHSNQLQRHSEEYDIENVHHHAHNRDNKLHTDNT